MKKIMCAFCGLSAALSVWAASPKFSYEIEDKDDGTCVLTAVHGVPNVKVELPSVVNGKTVTSLGYSIFKDYPDDDSGFLIPEIVIPDTVTRFNFHFLDMQHDPHVGRVVLPSALKQIEGVDDEDAPGWTPLNSDMLVSLSFSDGRTSNADGTYFLTGEGNRMLVHKGVTSKGDVYQNLIAYAGNCYREDWNRLPATIRIPDGITGIAASVFEDMESTKTFSFPASLRQLGADRGLGWLGPLEKVEIRGKNEGPYRIIGNSLVDMRTRTLMQATLNTVIPSDGSVTRIATWSFILKPYSDGAIGVPPDVVVPDAVEEIGASAFVDAGLSSVTVGKGVRLIGGGAFASLIVADDKGIRFFSIAAENPTYEVVNGCIVRKTDKTFVSPAVPQRQYRHNSGVPGVKYMYDYDLEVPYYCTKILSQALKDEYNVRTLVLPKNLAYDGDGTWWDEGLMPYSDVEHIRIADCRTMTDVLNSGTYANLKDKLGHGLEGLTFTDNPQCAVRTVGRVTVSGYGRYAPGSKVTLKAIYVEKGKQVVWYRYDEAREEASRTKAGEGRSLTFAMPQGNVFFSAELIDADGDPVDEPVDMDAEYGPFVPGERVSLALPALAGYAAKGLPAGLKLDRKTGTVSGSPTRPTGDAGAAVTFTKKGAPTRTARFVVGPVPTVAIALAGDAARCSVSGAGKAYLAGKRVTLAAKAPKGTAFVGWTRDGEPWPNAAESKSVKLSFPMPSEDLALVASFEKEKMSVACPRLADGTFTVGVAGGTDGIPLEISTQSGVKSVKASKLPSGMKLVKDKATGAWLIVGSPKKPGTYNVVLTVTAKSGATETITIPVEVQALPSWAVGTFAGFGEGEFPGYDLVEDNLYGTVTVAANGKVSGKFLFDTGNDRLLTSTFSAKALTGWEYDPEGGGYFLDVTLAFKDGRKVVASRDCRFRIEQNGGDVGIGGGRIYVSGADVTLYQNVWKVKGFENLPVFAEKKTVVSRTVEICGDEEVEDGTSTITLVLDRKGGVSATLVEEGIDRGVPFRDRFAFKGELIVIERWEEGGERFYEAEVPLVIGNRATAHVDVTMRVSPDGKVYADGCEITEWTDFGDWGPNE